MPAAHSTVLELVEPVPEEVPVGADVIFKLHAMCPEGCDLRGAPLKVVADDAAVLTEGVIAGATDAASEPMTDITIKTPPHAGDCTWTVVLPAHEHRGIAHQAATLPVRFAAVPRSTSLAVWSIPAFVVKNEPFAIKVGAKSSADCTLHGKEIEVCDAAGKVVAHGKLGNTPWPGTSALFWAEIEVPAPAQEGLGAWSVRFAAAGLELQHDDSRAGFTFMVVRPPEHTLTVKVVEKDTAAPIDNVQISVGVFRGATDESGRADMRISKGTYDLNVWKVGYEAPARTIEVAADATVQVEVLTVPEDDPDAVWLG
jgi:hypothetical protein